ncbi:MAG: peptide/nickel transport system ATP-binding protein [Nocardioidaceae bacterium]|nr:peptide/nickel transport system ATP-binding protein [Nocardioidaceae bacterium]
MTTVGQSSSAVVEPATGEPLLQVRDLAVEFRTEDGKVSAVDRISFDARAGELLAVVGESGCGKSVAAMALSGLLPHNARVTGSVRLAGAELVGASDATLRSVRGKDIAYIFQEPMTSLNPVFTIGRQVSEVLQVHEGMSRTQALARTVELLDLVGIPSPRERLKHYPHQLSGGLRQRVMIAMAVACNPRLLVADEPTTALDVTVQAGILDVLRDLRDRLGVAVVLITHDLGVVADVADRVMVMYAGRVVERGDVDELFARPRHHYTVGLLGAVPAARSVAGREQRLHEIPGLVPTLAEQPDSCTFADRCSAVTDRCRDKAPPLTLAPASTHEAACWHPAGVEESA